ncbi:Uncharacterised protein [Mycobacteroides abscessus subsp. abscessus]|nr:Uncharacterised protein [Mycobacteroides abscessus subsp. abscessus]
MCGSTKVSNSAKTRTATTMARAPGSISPATFFSAASMSL